ncbi:PAS domain S-box protein [Pleurocapsales cyanobacterium LEGE 06147]|nr:PAS domain S-box protein [Pleurocapsales cyanobacterium LEGE 06147]
MNCLSRVCSSSSIRILLADDDADLGESVKGLLSQQYNVEVVSDGVAALAAVRRQPPDLILLDIMIPGLDWLELLRQLRIEEASHKIPIILLCVRGSEESWLEKFEVEADDYLLKPFSERELLARVRVNLEIVRLRQEATNREQHGRTEAEAVRAQITDRLESITDGFFSLDEQWRFTYVNQASEQLWGKTRDELLGQSIWEIYPSLVGSVFEEQLRRAVTKRVAIYFETLSVRVELWHEVHAYPCHHGLYVYWRDISERKQVEEALQRREEKLNSIANAVPALIAYVDKEQRYRFGNKAYKEWFGHPVTEVYGKHIREVLGEPAYETIRPYVEQALSGRQVSFESQVPYRHGGTRYVSASYIPQIDSQGIVEGYVGLVNDITERKQVEEALQQANTRLRLALDAAKMGDWSWDATTDIVTFSQQAGKIFGISPGPYITWTKIIGELLYGEDKERVRLAIERAIEERSDYDIEYRVILADGTKRWIAAKGGAQYDASGNVLGMLGVVQDITERKQTEEALLESEERFRQMAETIQDVFWITDFPVPRILYISPAYERIWGRSRDDLYGDYTNWVKTIHPKDRQRVLALALTCQQENPVENEYRIVRPNGSIRWIRDRGFVLRDKSGEIKRVIGVAQDITARKQIEEDLRLSENRYRTLADAVPQLIWINDANGKVQFFNQRWQVYTGVSLKLDVEVCDKIVHPEDLQLVFEARTKAIQILEAYEVECRLKRFDQTYRWHLARVVPFKDSRGQVLYWFGTATDIDDIKRVEAEQRFLAETSAVLASSLDYQTTLTNIARLAVPFLADYCFFDLVKTDNKIERVAWHHVNPEKREWFDLIQRYIPSQDLENHPVARVLLKGDSILVSEVTDEWMQSIATSPEHLKFIRDSQLRSLITVPLITREQKLGALTLCYTAESGRYYTQTDLTLVQELANRAALALDNAQLYRQTREANRIKDEFLAVLSHELRTPLTPILGWAKLLRTFKFNKAETDTALATIEQNATIQIQLINDLLDVATILRGKLALNISPVNLVVPIEAAIETVGLAAQANSIQIQTQFASDVGLVAGDSGRLQQVVWNLLSNAVKFTPAGGRVEVRLSSVTARSSLVETDRSQRTNDQKQMTEDKFAQITVSDTGRGISPDFLPYIFDYFRQADSSSTRKVGGLGLGLAIVRHIVELHGGTVRAFSAGKGQGATFTVRLPVLTDESRSIRDDNSTSPSASVLPLLAGIRILVVDDEIHTRELLTVILQQAGAAVITVASAAEVLTTLAQAEFDVLIGDIGMPDMDGYSLMRQIRTSSQPQAEIPAIALTAYVGEFNRQKAIAVGFQRHLAKPIEPNELVTAVATLVKEFINQR